MEDIRIGRKTSWNRISIAFTLANVGTFVQVCPPNPNRVRLRFVGVNVAPILYVGSGANENQIATVTTTAPFVEFDVRDHGILVWQPFYTLPQVANVFLNCDEFILGEQ